MKASVTATIVISLFVANVAINAQVSNAYLAILPGWQFNRSNIQYRYTYDGYDYTYLSSLKSQDNFQGSIDAGWYFSKSIGIHVAYVYNDGRFIRTHVQYFASAPFSVTEIQHFERSWHILEAGPEFITRLGSRDQLYYQVNIGHSFGSTTALEWSAWEGKYAGSPLVVPNAWTFGGSFGYRHLLDNSVAFSIQAAYHYINTKSACWFPRDFVIREYWDLRVGICLRL